MDIGEEEKPLLHVFFDIEAMQDTKTHVANLVVAEIEEDGRPEHFKGETCMADFLEWLDALTAGDTRDTTAIARNFQGYDGYFVIDEYHRQNRIVEQVRNGGKIMQFNTFSCTTIASACNRDLRQNRMESNTLASEPLHGWRPNTNHSHVSLEWLHWEDSKLHRIQHARNKGEFRIPNSNYTVDGYDEVTKTVYEFQGCFYHGCRK